MSLELVTAGESHGPALVAIVTGLPAGLMLDQGAIREDLRRRRKGYGREAAVAWELARAAREKFAGDALVDFVAAHRAYLERISWPR